MHSVKTLRSHEAPRALLALLHLPPPRELLSACEALGHDEKHAPAWVSFLAGGTGGAVSVCLNNPIDVAKSKIQAGVSPGIISAVRETVRERGLIGLTSGLSVRVPRLFLSQAIQFTLVDQFKRLLQNC